MYMRPLPERQMDEAWGPSKINVLSEIGMQWTEKYFHFLFSRDRWVPWAQAVSNQRISAAAQIRSYASPYEICVGQSSTVTGLFLSTSVFSCLYLSTSDPLSSSST
jgi:hypothetical protein